ncbi:leucine-responsive regulatory protein [archaeon BMS3Abin16]|nr:leucine-responsive regulatory protein [archaeon BMS3Abin16]
MVDKEFSIAKVSGRIYKDVIFQKLLPSPKKKPEEKAEEKTRPSVDLSKVDETDLNIIKLLVKDSRTTLSAIGTELGIGTSTVYKRITRLVKEGVIRRFTILADGDKLGLGSAAYIGVTCAKGMKDEVIRKLLDQPEVVEIHEVLEPYDLLVKVRSRDLQSLKEGPLNTVSEIEGISETRSILVLNTLKEALYNL